MSSQIGLTISIVMIGLFTSAIIGFSITFANDNNAAINIGNSKAEETRSLIDKDLSGFAASSEETYKSILETTIEPGSDVIPSMAPISLTMWGLVDSLKNVIVLPITYIFGGWNSPFRGVFITFIGIIVFLFILYGIKTWRGNP